MILTNAGTERLSWLKCHLRTLRIEKRFAVYSVREEQYSHTESNPEWASEYRGKTDADGLLSGTTSQFLTPEPELDIKFCGITLSSYNKPPISQVNSGRFCSL